MRSLGEEFAAAMPAEIRQLQEQATARTQPRARRRSASVTAIMPLYRLSRYRPPRPPRVPATAPAISEPMQSQHDSPLVRHSTREAHIGADTNATSVNAHARRDLASREADGGRAEPPLDLPDVAWISGRDGTRALGDFEDQAARYHPARHELTINADFRSITDLIGHWRRRYQGVPGARTVIEGQVHEWCEQVLVEVVLAAAARAGRWSNSTRCSPQLTHRRPAPAPHAARGPPEATRAETRNRKTMIETTTASSWAPTGTMLDSPS